MAPPQHPFSRPLTRARARDVHMSPPMMSPPSAPSSVSRLSTTSSTDTPALGKRVHIIRRDSMMSPSRSSSSSSLSTMDSSSPNQRTGTLKRAPRYGVLALEQRHSATSPCPSSDEEEKVRTQSAKKPRAVVSPRAVGRSKTKEKEESSGSDTATPSPTRSPTRMSISKISRRASVATSPNAAKPSKPARINLQRNPSILGGPLPLPTQPAVALTKSQQAERARFARRMSFSTLAHASASVAYVATPSPSPVPEDSASLGSAFQLA